MLGWSLSRVLEMGRENHFGTDVPLEGIASNIDPSTLAEHQGVMSNLIGVLNSTPLKSGKYRVRNTGEKYEHREYRHQATRVLRLDDEVPPSFHNFNWIFFLIGIGGLGIGIYGIMLCHLSFGDAGSGIMLLKGIGCVITGWLAAVFGLFHWLNQP